MKRILILVLLLLLTGCDSQIEENNELQSTDKVEEIVYEMEDNRYLIPFDESYHTESVTEIKQDTDLLVTSYGFGHYEYLGSIQNVSIYRKHTPKMVVCTMDLVGPTSIGDGNYIYGGGGSSCNRSTFLVEGDKLSRISGNILEEELPIEDFNITTEELCNVPNVCLVDREINYPGTFTVGDDLITSDKELLSNNTGRSNFNYFGVVDGYRIYRSYFDEDETLICTMDMMPSTIISYNYYIFGGGSGSCYHKTYAVKNNEFYPISGYNHIDIEDLNIDAQMLCRLDSVCSITIGPYFHHNFRENMMWECEEDSCNYIGTNFENLTYYFNSNLETDISINTFTPDRFIFTHNEYEIEIDITHQNISIMIDDTFYTHGHFDYNIDPYLYHSIDEGTLQQINLLLEYINTFMYGL